MADDARGGAIGGESNGPILDRYRVEGPLGEGGFGSVVKAFDTRLKRTVAIKTLRRDTFAGDLDRFRMLEERFAREAEAGSRMGIHPHLVAVYDLVVDTNRTQHLILEYVAGGTLAERIAAGPLPIAEAFAIAAGAARGLQSAHSVGIVHRDIKPANIFLTGEGAAKVGDFGIAQIDEISRRTHTTTGHPGTPMYMSPEQANTTGYARPSSDQYSLGLVLFEMLTMKAYKRLERPEAAALLAVHLAPVRALVERMLANDPGDRYVGMAAVVAAIRDAERATQATPDAAPTDPLHTPTLLDMTVRETPRVNLSPVPPVLAPPAPRSMNRRAFIAGIGGLALAGGAAGAALLVTHRGDSAQGTAASTVNVPNQLIGTATAAAQGTAANSAVSTITPVALVIASPTPTSATVAAVTDTSTTPASASRAATTQTQAGPAPISSLLTYLDGRATLPGETSNGTDIIGDPVRAVGVDLSRGEPARLPAMLAPDTSRIVRAQWASSGTFLATLVRQPVAGGYSSSLDLAVIDVATGKTYATAKDLNSLPAWAPDGETLVYARIKREGTATINRYDVHFVQYDGQRDRLVATITPQNSALLLAGRRIIPDPIEAFIRADQFFNARGRTLWAADNSRVGVTIDGHALSVRPDGSDARDESSSSLGDVIGPATDDPYIPANGVQVRVVDDDDAIRWHYDRNLFPTEILDGCYRETDSSGPCTNTRRTTPNAGYRNQIVAVFPDGTSRKITNSPTFKYHVSVSPDGYAIAFTGLTVGDYEAARVDIIQHGSPENPYAGYTTDVYSIRLAGGGEQNISKSGIAHHASWQRDLPVKPVPRPTATPYPTPAPQPTSPPTTPPEPTRTPTPAPPPTNTPVPTQRPATATTWTDSERKISIAYIDQQWRATRDASDQYNILELDSVDGVFLYLSKYTRGTAQSAGNALMGIQGYRDRQAKRTDRTYTQGSIQQGRADGGAAASMEFQSTSKTNRSDVRTGIAWYIDGPDRQFVIEAFANGTTFRRRDEVATMINSIRLTK